MKSRLHRLAVAVVFLTTAALLSTRASAVEPWSVVGIARTPSGDGYWLMNAAGTVFPFGDATDLGNFPAETGPYRALAATQDGRGLWAVTEGPAGVGGHVHALGRARSFGNFANACCGHCCSGLIAMTNGLGLIGLGSDGAVRVVGKAPAFGNFPVIPGDAYMTMIATPSGRGLTAVTESGRVRTLGEAVFFGDLSDDPGACISCVP